MWLKDFAAESALVACRVPRTYSVALALLGDAQKVWGFVRMGRACWFGQERSSEQSRRHEPTGKALLPVCGSQLRDAEGIERSLVADVDLVRRPKYSAAVSVPVGRGNCAAGRHAARLRRAVRAEATVSIHG